MFKSETEATLETTYVFLDHKGHLNQFSVVHGVRGCVIGRSACQLNEILHGENDDSLTD